MILPLLLKFAEITFKGNILKTLLYKDILQVFIVVFIIITVSITIAVYPIARIKISEILNNEK